MARTCKLTDTTLSEIVDRIQHRKPRPLSLSLSPLRFAFVRFTIVKLGPSFHGLSRYRIPVSRERERERERYAWTVVVSIFFPTSTVSIFTLASSFPSSFVHGLNRLSSSLWEDNDRGEFYSQTIRNIRN